MLLAPSLPIAGRIIGKPELVRSPSQSPSADFHSALPAPPLYHLERRSTTQERHHEDAAGNANGISAVRQGMERRRSAGSALSLGPGAGGPRHRRHPRRRAPGCESCSGLHTPHPRPAALEAQGDSGRRGGRAHRTKGAVRAADCGGGRQAHSPGARGGGALHPHIQNRRRGSIATGRRDHSAGPERGQRGALGTGAAFSCRPGAGHYPVQLSAEPGGAQVGARDGCRLPVSAEARTADSVYRPCPRRSDFEGGLAAGGAGRAAAFQRRHRVAGGEGRSHQAGHIYRVGEGGLGAEGSLRPQARAAGVGQQLRHDYPRRLARSGRCSRSHCPRGLWLCRAVVHQRAARVCGAPYLPDLPVETCGIQRQTRHGQSFG